MILRMFSAAIASLTSARRWRPLLCCLAISSVFADSTVSQEDTLALVEARLLLMKDVARHKWHHQQPVEDLAREQVVLQHARSDALRYGLHVDTYVDFMHAQINAAKVIQQHWFRRWYRGTAPTKGPDLSTELRPQLITLGQHIAHSLRVAREIPPEKNINVAGLDSRTRAALVTALGSVRTYDDRLTQVLSSRTLRVGTTGDYAPFSFVTEGDSTDADPFPVRGIDIDLARDLAGSLDVDVVFVRTSWPSLMDDLASGLFDVGMSGISRTISRSREAFFSQPYHLGGKTAIARCDDRSRFTTIADIDQPGVRVIVNPGGTNEKFARQLNKATVRVFDNNAMIFNEIVDNRADVMITDLIEVRLQTRLHKDLCGTMDTPVTYQEKAYLMPQDVRLKEVISTWLDQRLGDGTVESLFHRHLSDTAGQQ